MTGFGRGEYKDDRYECTVEIKTINHRYKDYSIRMPRQLNSIEDKIRKIVNSYITRGRIEIYIHFEFLNQEEREVKLDLGLAKGYYSALNKLKMSFPEINEDIKISLLARFPEIIKVDDKEYDVEELWGFLYIAMKSALEMLSETRTAEGKNLKVDLLSRCNKIKDSIKSIKYLAPEVEKEYKKRLTEKIIEYTNSIELDETRILTEVAILADKTNITEELIRLNSHIDQFENTLNENTIGRKLDFLVQEMNREINTIGSKGNYYSIATEVVSIKSELEKIREQIQNIE
jgi:uncharacterized protein (TIGR00255 family)